jgi:hypothetical protein
LGVSCAVLIGCGSKAPVAHWHVHAGPPPGRYWLSHTAVLSKPGGDPSTQVEAPVLVDVWPDGRVKSIAGGKPVFDGYLPEEVRSETGTDRGLLLIVQAETELHWHAPDGELAGHLYPGAWVSVLPGSSPSTRVGNLPFSIARDQVLFAERAKLGTTKQLLQTPRHPGALRALRLPTITGFITSNKPDTRFESAWTMDNCRDTLVFEDPVRLVQYARGAELSGLDSDDLNDIFPAANFYDTLTCPPRLVSKLGAGLVWTDPDTELAGFPLERVPEHYRLSKPVEAAPLEDAMRRGGSLYWLLQNEKGILCDEWQFAQARPAAPALPESARLIRRKRLDWGGAPQRVTFRVIYSPAKSGAPARLELAAPEFNGEPALRCECNYDYALLDAQGEELTMMGRPLPPTFVAYDPGEAERWFLSESACQSARAAVSTQLASDGSTATRLGLHAVLAPFGI